MANRTRPTLEKRAKERARQEKRKAKEERRATAKINKANNPRGEGEEDPDIAGIVPGPQPIPWADEDEETD
ncbi:MAG: hypothetical protein QM736_19225 [Vicinamibacterales bacterium]